MAANTITEISTYQERREAKRYIEQRLRDLDIGIYAVRRAMRTTEPAKIRAARKAIDAYEKTTDKQASKVVEQYQKLVNPVREDLVLGRFTEAIHKIKGLEKARASLMKKGVLNGA